MRIYFYPITTKKNNLTKNPYVTDFLKALMVHHDIVNFKDASSIGILKVAKYFFRIDVLILNWIEDLPEKRGGYFQSVFFMALIFISRLFHKKTVWIMHNKFSHRPGNLGFKKFLFRFILTHCDLIITHAKEGIDFAHSLVPETNINIHHFPHPIKPSITNKLQVKEIDILIWGSLAPYKGIDVFLNYLYENNLEHSYKILITGRITTEKHRLELFRFQNECIEIKDRFVDKQDLEEYVNRSKIVLFTYSNDSILSSGALIDSLSFGAQIIGPHTGNFKDLQELGLIFTYNNFGDLIIRINSCIKEPDNISKKNLELFFEEASWPNFIAHFNSWIRTG